MPCANARQTARNDLAALGNKALQQANIAVGDRVDLLGAELADLLAPEKLAAARAAARTAGWTRSARTCARAGVTAAWAGGGCVLLSRLRAVVSSAMIFPSQYVVPSFAPDPQWSL